MKIKREGIEIKFNLNFLLIKIYKYIRVIFFFKKIQTNNFLSFWTYPNHFFTYFSINNSGNSLNIIKIFLKNIFEKQKNNNFKLSLNNFYSSECKSFEFLILTLNLFLVADRCFFTCTTLNLTSSSYLSYFYFIYYIVIILGYFWGVPKLFKFSKFKLIFLSKFIKLKFLIFS